MNLIFSFLILVENRVGLNPNLIILFPDDHKIR